MVKEMVKELKRQKGISAHLFMIIMKLGEHEGKRSQVACEEEIEGK